LLDQASALGNLHADTIRQALEEPLLKLSEALAKRNIQFHPQQALDKFLDQEMTNLLNFDQFISSFSTIVGVTGDVLIGFFAVSFITFNFLREPEMPTQVLMLMAPRKNARQVMNILNESTRLLRRYFVGLLIQFTLVTTLLMLGLILVGAYNPVLIAVVAGVFNLVPYVGPIIGITFACLITLTSTLSMDFTTVTLPLLLNVLGVFGFVMAFDAFLNVPLIYSRTVRAHPLEIFLVILGSGKLAGIPGMILAIPCYTVIRVILREFFNQYEVVRRLTRNL
jgi:predicted PurR-regulated permease PerM